MAGALAQPPGPGASFPPIEFFYRHLHDAIRGELATLSAAVLALEGCDSLEGRLRQLRERYRFLGQVYKYHSSVEDEVRGGRRAAGRGGAGRCRRAAGRGGRGGAGALKASWL